MLTLSVRNISKEFRSKVKTVKALDGATLDVAEGEVGALLGLNGAGKTTFVKVVASLLTPDSGDVIIAGKNIAKSERRTIDIGVLLEGNRNIYWRLTPFENLEFFGVLRGLSMRAARARADQLLAEFNLDEKRDAVVRILSRGMQQRLAVALALVNEPKLLILDEPTLGVDLDNTTKIVTILKAYAAAGMCILLTSHQLDFVAKVATKVALIDHGKIISCEPAKEFDEGLRTDDFDVELNSALSPNEASALQLAEVRIEGLTLKVPSRQLQKALSVIDSGRLKLVSKPAVDLGQALLRRMGR